MSHQCLVHMHGSTRGADRKPAFFGEFSWVTSGRGVLIVQTKYRLPNDTMQVELGLKRLPQYHVSYHQMCRYIPRLCYMLLDFGDIVHRAQLFSSVPGKERRLSLTWHGNLCICMCLLLKYYEFCPVPFKAVNVLACFRIALVQVLFWAFLPPAPTAKVRLLLAPGRIWRRVPVRHQLRPIRGNGRKRLRLRVQYPPIRTPAVGEGPVERDINVCEGQEALPLHEPHEPLFVLLTCMHRMLAVQTIDSNQLPPSHTLPVATLDASSRASWTSLLRTMRTELQGNRTTTITSTTILKSARSRSSRDRTTSLTSIFWTAPVVSSPLAGVMRRCARSASRHS